VGPRESVMMMGMTEVSSGRIDESIEGERETIMRYLVLIQKSQK